jgi:hypothetical protein
MDGNENRTCPFFDRTLCHLNLICYGHRRLWAVLLADFERLQCSFCPFRFMPLSPRHTTYRGSIPDCVIFYRRRGRRGGVGLPATAQSLRSTT